MNKLNKTIRVVTTDSQNLLEFIAELQNDWHPSINFANAKIHCIEDDYDNHTIFVFENDTLQINAIHIDSALRS